VRFLDDANLPPAIARLLIDHGHEAEHVSSAGLLYAKDSAIWDCAIKTGATIVTRDRDFADRKVLAKAGPNVVWIRLPNARRSHLLAWFSTMLPSVVSALANGESIIEVV
jgi:predicted nuclease of predicted toxin-antitoxin system